jgi:hypothetical protein
MLWQLESCIWRERINEYNWFNRKFHVSYTKNQSINQTMCITTRMELTGWYYRDQDVTKPCVLLHVWS